jgi:Transposase DDE domain
MPVTCCLIEDLLMRLMEKLNCAAFCAEHRSGKEDFTRKRCLTLPVVVVFLLQQVGGRSLQEGLDTFFMAMNDRLECVRTVTKSAFSQARKKLKASAFVALNRMWVQQWHASALFDRWFDMRVLAADGTCLRLPHLRENSDKYGLGPVDDGSVAMARCVALFSVASRQWLEMVVGRYDEGERELLLKALDQITPNDVLVLDRGYPAWWLFAALQARNVNFCARIEGCGWSAVEKLLRSDESELVMRQRLKSHDRKKLKDHGLVAPEMLSLRLVKVLLPNGRYEVLATSLMDTQRFPTHAFGELYHRRWSIEEGFKLVKQRQHLEGFSGELPASIEQEIQAKILLHNITQAVCHQAQQCVPPTKRDTWQVNRAHALKQIGRTLIFSFKGASDSLRRYVESLTTVLSKTLERIRPNRSFPRKHSIGGAHRPRKSYR